jgi:hypothetical protein
LQTLQQSNWIEPPSLFYLHESATIPTRQLCIRDEYAADRLASRAENLVSFGQVLLSCQWEDRDAEENRLELVRFHVPLAEEEVVVTKEKKKSWQKQD